MSEYIEIDVEESDDSNVIVLVTNLRLAEDGPEQYEGAAEMEEGSALAQFLSPIAGIVRLKIEDDQLEIVRAPETAWHSIIEDISAAIKEFFL
jgi:hypothetical protein